MTNVMLATYPIVFKAGAPIAGVPFKCATTVGSSLLCNTGAVTKTPEQWGNLVRGATNWSGPWPRVSVWHGTNDLTVIIADIQETMEQWTNVHKANQAGDSTVSVGGYPHKVYRDSNGAAVVETSTINGMVHGQPVDPGTGSTQCGTVTGYNLNAGICASYHNARWFGL